jgi:hypothetical protein
MKLKKDLCTGSYDKLPHHAVIGNPSDFYVWLSNEVGGGKSSDWIKGQSNIYHELDRLQERDKPAFRRRIEDLMLLNDKVAA